MADGLDAVAGLAALATGYWGVDFVARRGGLARAARALGVVVPTRAAVVAGAALTIGLAPLWRWEHVPQADAVRAVALLLAAVLAWKASTRDIDVVSGGPGALARLALVACAAAVTISPAFIAPCAVLLGTLFGMWQHHATLPMRLLQAVAAFVVLAPIAPFGLLSDAGTLLHFLVTIQAAHYVITALAKALLGPRPWSWVVDNRLDHLAASAWSWGWARFVPWPRWRRVIEIVRRVRVPLQAGAFGLELLAPLALLDARLALGFCLAWSAFHLGVFALSGLLFWDWIGANLAVALGLFLLPETSAAEAFGWLPLGLGAGFLVALPLRHKLFAPMPLGWWDSPFTQRMHWIAHGESGTDYGVYADLMCPHERLYGKVHGCFLAPHPVCTYHLGECFRVELRDALRAAGPCPEALDGVRARFGITPRDEAMAHAHRRYLAAFFDALNRGAPKRVLPRALRWLKAPGGQIFYWGDLPAYRGQEPIASVSLRYREEYFDGARLHRLRDELVEAVEVEPLAPGEQVREATPKEVDRLLLSHAIGRLIELPAFAGGYVGGDDGRNRADEIDCA
ncbi:MAG TPA: hypothetical protein RMH99_07675 [Sandaracinaceae bacterium LLY-WYZ-13_1]|nr:hypothetical protein [Sandaracinaceae bacterium LLY-WYZ-13_1]